MQKRAHHYMATAIAVGLGSLLLTLPVRSVADPIERQYRQQFPVVVKSPKTGSGSVGVLALC